MVLCLVSVWYLQFRGLCLLYSFRCEFCNVGQAFIWERIFFARNVKAFSGYLRKPKNMAMYTIFNVNVCTYVNISSVVEFQGWGVLNSKIFAM